MPIYEYKCSHCSKVYEELVPMNTEGEGLKCPACGQVGAKRLISAFAAHGLENGHIAVGQKLTGGGSSSPASAGGGCCGGNCACGK